MNRTVKTQAPAKITKVAKATPHVEDKAQIADSTLFDDVMKRYTEAQDALLAFFKAPSWKRTMCAVITYIAGCVGVSYLATSLVELMMVGAVSLGTPIFLGLIIAILAAVLVVWYGHKAVMRVSGSILTGEADERALAAYDSMKSLAARLNPFGKRTVAAA